MERGIINEVKEVSSSLRQRSSLVTLSLDRKDFIDMPTCSLHAGNSHKSSICTYLCICF